MTKLTNILIGPIDLPTEFRISPQVQTNPGMGGAEFHSIQLALELSKNFGVTLWIRTGWLFCDDLKVCRNFRPEEVFDLQICYTGHAVTDAVHNVKLIAISHHPFDGSIKHLPERIAAIVNVGRYQLLSNARTAARLGARQYWLPVFYPPSQAALRTVITGRGFKVGHLSSLHPSKGFHVVLKGWTRFQESSPPQSTLEVIGGISLYGFEETHSDLPVAAVYGQRLMKILEQGNPKTVVFRGRVAGDLSEELQAWDAAVLNPKAIGESENVSMKDCWRNGVPVISGNYFGHRDYMKDFPELVAGSPRKISNVLKRLQKDPELREQLRQRSLKRYDQLVESGKVSRLGWNQLVADILENETPANEGVFLRFRPTISETLGLFRDELFLTGLRAAIWLSARLRGPQDA